MANIYGGIINGIRNKTGNIFLSGRLVFVNRMPNGTPKKSVRNTVHNESEILLKNNTHSRFVWNNSR